MNSVFGSMTVPSALRESTDEHTTVSNLQEEDSKNQASVELVRPGNPDQHLRPNNKFGKDGCGY